MDGDDGMGDGDGKMGKANGRQFLKKYLYGGGERDSSILIVAMI